MNKIQILFWRIRHFEISDWLFLGSMAILGGLNIFVAAIALLRLSPGISIFAGIMAFTGYMVFGLTDD